MANLTLTIGGRPLKIQCSDDNVETVKDIASSISKLIDDENKENWRPVDRRVTYSGLDRVRRTGNTGKSQ